MSMLRPLIRTSATKATLALQSGSRVAARSMATRSGDDARKSTAVARLHLEDGTTLTGTSFGCHESVEGEVSAAFSGLIIIHATQLISTGHVANTSDILHFIP